MCALIGSHHGSRITYVPWHRWEQAPIDPGDIADVLGISLQTAGPLRSGLIKKGMIWSPAHGQTAFTVPMFGE